MRKSPTLLYVTNNTIIYRGKNSFYLIVLKKKMLIWVKTIAVKTY